MIGQVTIFAKEGCAPCARVRALLLPNGQPLYAPTRVVVVDATKKPLLQKVLGLPSDAVVTLPRVFFNAFYVGDSAGTIDLHAKGALDVMAETHLARAYAADMDLQDDEWREAFEECVKA